MKNKEQDKYQELPYYNKLTGTNFEPQYGNRQLLHDSQFLKRHYDVAGNEESKNANISTEKAIL